MEEWEGILYLDDQHTDSVNILKDDEEALSGTENYLKVIPFYFFLQVIGDFFEIWNNY